MKSDFPGLGGKKTPDSIDVKGRGNASYKDMTMREYLSLQLYTAMVGCDQWKYFNEGEVFGEEKYALDAVLGADFLIATLNRSPSEVHERYNEVQEYLEEYRSEDDEEDEDEDDEE